MSSAQALPENSNPEREPLKKRSNRQSLFLLGALLIAFGVSLPFAADFYYRSRFSQINDDRPVKKLPTVPTSRERSLFKPSSNNNAPSPQTADISPPTYSQQGNPDKKNPIEKFIDWVRGLFRKNKRPKVQAIQLSETELTYSCPLGAKAVPGETCQENMQVDVFTDAFDANKDELFYKYTVTGGRIIGQGAKVIWDLNGSRTGSYKIIAAVADKRGFGDETKSATVTVRSCKCGQPVTCPQGLSVSGGGVLNQGGLANFTAFVDTSSSDVTYNWTVSAGTISSGQGTPSISVDTSGIPRGSTFTATVQLGNVSPNCPNRTASESASIAGYYPSPTPTRTPQAYGSVKGVVVDGNGAAIPFATVTIRGNGISRTFTTNDSGEFLFENLPPGDYQIFVQMSGFSARQYSAKVEIGQSSDLTLTLDTGTLPTQTPTPGITPSPNANVNVNATVNTNVNANINANVNSNTNASNNGNVNISNTNSTVKIPLGDKVRYSHPDRFIKNTEYDIDLKLMPAKPEDPIYQTVNTNANRITVQQRIETLPQVEGYDTYVEAELIPADGLTITGSPEKVRWIYKRDEKPENLPQWVWRVKMTDDGSRRKFVNFDLRLNVELISQKTGEVSRKDPAHWTGHFERPVGIPFGVWITTAFTVFSGGLALIFGFIPALEQKKEDVLEDEVNCAAYSPSKVKAGNDFVIQVFAHLAEQMEKVSEIARQFDPNAKEPIPDRITNKIKRGSTISFRLVIESLGIDKQSDTHQWNGEIVRERFVVSVPENQNPSQRWGKIYLVENSVPVGNLMFQFEIVADATKSIEPSPETGNFKRFETPFISYSSKDRWKVLMRVQMLDAEKKNYFMDVLSLKRGERWAEKIDEYIDKCDVFYLFWSKNAKNSDYVKKEILRAYQRQGGKAETPPDIIPIPIEKPPPVEPPEELKFLHFNDQFSYLIFAAERETLLQRFRYWFLSLFFWKND